MKGTTYIHEGELTEKAKENLKKLKEQKEKNSEKLIEEFKAMKLLEKEGMFPSDDAFLIK